MVELLIVADDFTGALDTGIQFADHANTKVLAATDVEKDFFLKTDTEVLVIDTETRHLTKEKAYHIIMDIVKEATEAGVNYIYKKTDSGLRGNIGSELAGAMEGSGKTFIPFIPALPSMNRITVQGIHYIDGVPIHKSVFGSDPYEPVKSPYVKDLFTDERVNVAVLSGTEEYKTDYQQPTIGIFDAQSMCDFQKIIQHLKRNNQLHIIAGCAGFAEAMSGMIRFHKKDTCLPKLTYPLLVLCGSLNPITRAQIERGKEMGYAHIILSPRQLLEENYFMTEEGKLWLILLREKMQKYKVVMIDSGILKPDIMEDYIGSNNIDVREVRKKIPRAMGVLLFSLYQMEKDIETTAMIIGGDTIWGFIEKNHCKEINMVCEVMPGTVLSSIDVYGKNAWIISKSGGFGTKDTIVDVVKKLEA